MEISALYRLFLDHPVVTTDSRNCPQDALFLALRGESFNGNLFAAKALAAGCSHAVVDDESVVPAGDARYILVDDTLKTYQALAREHRRHFSGPVVQITGTNGKTTTKELVAAVLGQKYRVLATEANYNNHIGVPRTLLRLAKEHEIAVIETGANHPGEIRTLSDIVEPDYGLITNVGIAHLEGFGSFEGVKQTKGELYDYLRRTGGRAFLNRSNPHLAAMASGLSVIGYGQAADGLTVEGEVVESMPYLTLRWRRTDGGAWHEVKTRLVGAYNADNALAAACVGAHFGVTDEAISRALADYTPNNDRSELRQTASNRLIVDAYNANPTSMMVALESFVAMAAERKMVVLGEMSELGDATATEHRRVVDYLHGAAVETVWLVGPKFAAADPAGWFRHFQTVDDVKAALEAEPVAQRTILIKGSHSTRLYTLPAVL